MKVKQFDSKTIDLVQDDIRRAMFDIQAKYGISVSFGRISYNDGEYRCKMTVATTTPLTWKPAVPELNIHGVFAELQGKSFKEPSGRNVYTVVGVRPARRRGANDYLIVETQSGKRYKITPEAIKNFNQIG